MGWFWADAPADAPSKTSTLTRPPNHPTTGKPPPSCPMHASTPPSTDKSGCPYTPPTSDSPHDSSSLNPLNLMFAFLPQSPSENQKTLLPTERELSSIPKGTAATEGNWEYPSPQQMYNAMRRKGYDDTPEDAVESMVAVHNFLNEGAWGEIINWEKRFSGGILNALIEKQEERPEPRLLRFQGRSKDLTPKARMFQILGKIYPSKFGTSPPFDRHDWYVLRTTPGSTEQREIRYVIDYYSAPPEPTGEPVFYLDVRPALDRPSAILERVFVWGGDVWEKASGADVRRAEAAEKAARSG